MARVISYIDGYNLYHALNDSGWRRYMWLDIQHLSQRLLKFNQELVTTKYFTARTTGSAAKKRRQNTYIEALQTLNHLEIFEGRFQDEPHQCPNPNCRRIEKIPKEKKTDVNIAVQMMYDCFRDRFDYALLISADADLVPIIETIKGDSAFSEKRVIVALPPGRSCVELMKVAHGHLAIGRSHFAQSQLPPRIIRSDGFALERPTEWS